MESSRTIPRTSLLPSLIGLSSVCWTIGAVLAVGVFYSVEWSHPYCNHQSDGPGYAAYGFPLPYMAFSGVSSLEYDVMPHILLLDYTLQATLAYPLLRWVVHRLSSVSTWIAAILSVTGMLFLLAAASFQWTFLSFDWPVSSIAQSGSYWDYRPVGFTNEVGRHQCSPSEFWFGAASDHAAMR
jgi:hypothetical protein